MQDLGAVTKFIYSDATKAYVWGKEIFDVLRTDVVIKSELGGEFIYQFVKGNDKTDIWLTFSELNSSPGLYAENEEKTTNVMYQVDIWSMAPIKTQLNL